MAALVLKMSVSLDGYVAPLDGSTDWIAAGGSRDGLSWTKETVSNADAHLVGAATYAGWAGYWPGASGPFAKRPVAGRDRPDRRVPPHGPPGRPGRGRGALPRAAHHRAGEHHRLQRRRRRPRLHRAPVTLMLRAEKWPASSGNTLRRPANAQPIGWAARPAWGCAGWLRRRW